MKLLLKTIAAVVLATTAFADPIHTAAWDGDLAGVQAELDKGVDVNEADINFYNLAPLHYAAIHGQKEIAELLIAAGADVSANTTTRGTPLHLVAFEGHKEIIELLIAEGADVNAIIVSGPLQFNVGDIALNFTTDSEIAALLRKHGGMTSEELRSGMTPLHLAAVNGHKEIVELLIAKGADVNEKIASGSNKNKTPLDFAVIKKQNETANLLRTHGGKTAEELALMPRLVQRGPREFSFLVKKAKIYEVQSSFNLLNWEVIKTYNQHGPRILFEDERDFEPQKIFYRVKVVE
jgi:cytohesin